MAPIHKADIEGLLKRLSDLCQGDVVLTGISFEPEKLGAAVYERKTDKIAYAFTQKDRRLLSWYR